METKTIYVPIEQVVLLPEFLSVYHNGTGRIDLIKEDMVVMTKADVDDMLYEFTKFYYEYFKNGNPCKGLPTNSDLECVNEFLENYKIEP